MIRKPVAALLLLSLCTLAGQLDARIDTVLERLPGEPVAVLYSAGTGFFAGEGRDTAMTALWEREGLKDCLAMPYQRAKALLPMADVPEEAALMLLPLIEALASGPMALAILSADIDTEAFLAMPEHRRGEVVAAGVKLALIVHAPAGSPAREAINRVTALTANFPPEMVLRDGPITRLAGLPAPLAWGYDGDLFLVGWGGGVTDGLMRRQPPAGQMPAALAAMPAGEPLAFAYLDIAAIGAAVAPLAAEARPIVEGLLAAVPQRITHKVVAHGKGFRRITHSALPQGAQPAEPITLNALRHIPHNATTVNAGTANFTEMFDAIDAIVQRLHGLEPDAGMPPSLADALKPFETELGLSIRNDLLGSLGNTWTVYTPAHSNMLWLPDPVIAIEATDHAKLRLSIDRVMLKLQQLAEAHGQHDTPRLAFSRAMYGGAEFQVLRFTGAPVPFAPAWSIRGNQLIAAASVPTLKAALDQSAPGGTSILNNDDFKTVFGQVAQRERYARLAYTDTRRQARSVFGLLPLAYTALAAAMPADIGLDPAKLPSADRVMEHLFGTVSAQYADGGVMVSDTFGPFPVHLPIDFGEPGVLMAGAPMMAAMLFPALNQARRAAPSTAMLNNTRNAGMACYMFATADVREGKFPNTLKELVDKGFLDDPRSLADIHTGEAEGFVLVPGLKVSDRADWILLYSKQPSPDGQRYAFFIGGNAQLMPEAEFKAMLEKQQREMERRR